MKYNLTYNYQSANLLELYPSGTIIRLNIHQWVPNDSRCGSLLLLLDKGLRRFDLMCVDIRTGTAWTSDGINQFNFTIIWKP